MSGLPGEGWAEGVFLREGGVGNPWEARSAMVVASGSGKEIVEGLGVLLSPN